MCSFRYPRIAVYMYSKKFLTNPRVAIGSHVKKLTSDHVVVGTRE